MEPRSTVRATRSRTPRAFKRVETRELEGPLAIVEPQEVLALVLAPAQAPVQALALAQAAAPALAVALASGQPWLLRPHSFVRSATRSKTQ